MKSLPKISIIIPLYNVEDYIIECLESVAQQTYIGAIECIVVDDCGKDNSLTITKQFIDNYDGSIDFKIVHHTTNRGLSAARNTGVDYATGDYIYFLDSDDYISLDCLEVLTAPLKLQEYDMVVGDLKMFGNPRDIVFLPEKQSVILGNQEIFKHWYVDRLVYVMAWNKLTKATLFKQYDLTFLEGQLHEDELWTYKIASNIQSLAIQKHCTYYYRIRENSITANYADKVIDRYKSCYDTLLYVISHPANVSTEYYQKCVIYYFGVLLRNTFGLNFNYKKDYIRVRKQFKYSPWTKFFLGHLSLKDLKHQLHFCLPPLLGYLYLKLKRFKQNY